MLFRQKLIVAFMGFLFFAAMIVLIIGVVGLLFIGFNLFTICFTILGIALYALLFYISLRLKGKANNSSHNAERFNKNPYEKLQITLKNRPAFFRLNARLVYFGAHIYLAGLLAIWIAISFVNFWLGNILDSFGGALGMELVITWGTVIHAMTTIRMLFTSPSYDGLAIEQENCPELFQLLSRASALTKTPNIDSVLLSDYSACSIYRIKTGLRSPKVVAHLDTRLLFYLDENELFALFVNAMLISEKKKGALIEKLDRRLAQWTTYNNTAFSKRRVSPVGFFGNKYFFALLRYINVLSKADTIIADEDSSVLLNGTIISEALIKQEFINETFYLNCYSLPLKLFNVSEHPDNYYIWLRERYLEQTKCIPRTWLNVIENYDSENDGPMFLTLAERLNELKVDISILNTSFSSGDYPPYLDTVSKLIQESGGEKITHEWNEQHDLWKTTVETANTETADDRQLFEKIDALLMLNEFEQTEMLLTKLCELPEPTSAALFRRGKLRLDKNDSNGFSDLIRVVELDATESGEAIHRLQEYKNEHQEAFDAELNTWLENAQKRFDRQQSEMNEIRTTDVFLPVTPELDLKTQITTKLNEIQGATKAVLVKKAIAGASFDLYILAVAHGQLVSSKTITSNIWNLHFALRQDDLRLSVIDLNSNPAFWKPFALVPGSLIYEKAGDRRG